MCAREADCEATRGEVHVGQRKAHSAEPLVQWPCRLCTVGSSCLHSDTQAQQYKQPGANLPRPDNIATKALHMPSIPHPRVGCVIPPAEVHGQGNQKCNRCTRPSPNSVHSIRHKHEIRCNCTNKPKADSSMHAIGVHGTYSAMTKSTPAGAHPFHSAKSLQHTVPAWHIRFVRQRRCRAPSVPHVGSLRLRPRASLRAEPRSTAPLRSPAALRRWGAQEQRRPDVLAGRASERARQGRSCCGAADVARGGDPHARHEVKLRMIFGASIRIRHIRHAFVKLACCDAL
eukprot:6196406-Pleurochrysis_carterae.AAC.1